MPNKIKKKHKKPIQEKCDELNYFRPLFIIIPFALIIFLLILLFFVFFNNSSPEVLERNTTIYVQMYAGPQAEAMSSTAIYWNEHYAKETRIFVRTFPLKNMDYFDKLKVELLSGISSPDIVNPFSFQLEELRPYLEPLNKYLIEDEFRILPDGQRFSTDSLIPLVLNNINSSDGQIYMLPNEIRGLVLYYRNDLILNPPQTWEEFIEIGKNYTQSLNPNSTTKYGIILPSEYDIWTFASALEMIWSYGDDLFLDPSAYYKNPGINLNATVRSFEIFEELTKFNITSFDLNNLENLDSASLLKTNDFAMALDWTDSYSNLINNSNLSKDYNKFEITLPPGVRLLNGTIKRNIYVETSNLAVNKYSKNKGAAMEFLFWATLGEGAQIYANSSSFSNLTFLSPTLAFEVNNSSAPTIFYSKIYPWINQYGRFVTPTSDIADILLIGSSYLQGILIQNTTAYQALNDFNKDIFDLLNGKKT